MKTYTITVKQTKKGVFIKRINKGFSAFELLGFLSFIKDGILNIISGKDKPDISKDKFTITSETNIDNDV